MSGKDRHFTPGDCARKFVFLLLACSCGCATQRAATVWQTQPVAAEDARVIAQVERGLREILPAQYRATHRAIITVRQRQFVCDGFLDVSPADGWHLALVSTLGLITDVRVKTNGAAEILRVTPLFRKEWSRDHVVPELRWLFGPSPPLLQTGRLSDGRLGFEGTETSSGVQARYLCSADGARWEEIEVRDGVRRLFHARLQDYRRFPGCEREIPTDIELDASTHKLHVRIVALTATGAPTTETTR